MVDYFLKKCCCFFWEREVNNCYLYNIELKVSISILKCLVTYDVLFYTLFDLTHSKLSHICHLTSNLILWRYFLNVFQNTIPSNMLLHKLKYLNIQFSLMKSRYALLISVLGLILQSGWEPSNFIGHSAL